MYFIYKGNRRKPFEIQLNPIKLLSEYWKNLMGKLKTVKSNDFRMFALCKREIISKPQQ